VSEPSAAHALIPAAGRGERLGGGVPKQLLVVAGKPLLRWAVERLRAAGVASCVVAAPAEEISRVEALLAGEPVRVVAGGATRQESVARALAASPALAGDLVLVHDAARAAVHPEDVRAAIAAAADAGGAGLGRPVTDTVKRVQDGAIAATVDRGSLFRAETPQVFRRELFERACAAAAAAGFTGTDESSLVERLSAVRIAAVHAAHPNPKVTFADDLAWVAALLAPAEPVPDHATAAAEVAR
jgi:2-C-methyl-D-erythritol 4-phosphate cytidylyltransferase